MRVLVIDNYDSFTWNLVHLAAGCGAVPDVERNDALGVEDIRARDPDALLLSPGPGTPDDSGVTLAAIEAFAPTIPIFGVCLGLQAIGQAFGGRVVRAPAPKHGKVSTVTHDGTGVFRGLNQALDVVRYHSLVVDRGSVPPELRVSASTDDGLIMGASHRAYPVHGVQFHPESIRSEGGAAIMKNFLDLAAQWNKTSRPERP